MCLVPYLHHLLDSSRQHSGDSPVVVQWIRLRDSSAGGAGSIPGWETKIFPCHAVWPKPKKKQKTKKPENKQYNELGASLCPSQRWENCVLWSLSNSLAVRTRALILKFDSRVILQRLHSESEVTECSRPNASSTNYLIVQISTCATKKHRGLKNLLNKSTRITSRLQSGLATSWSELASPHLSFGLIPHLMWRRQWHPTPVLLPGESHGWRSLVGCSPWGR